MTRGRDPVWLPPVVCLLWRREDTRKWIISPLSTRLDTGRDGGRSAPVKGHLPSIMSTGSLFPQLPNRSGIKSVGGTPFSHGHSLLPLLPPPPLSIFPFPV